MHMYSEAFEGQKVYVRLLPQSFSTWKFTLNCASGGMQASEDTSGDKRLQIYTEAGLQTWVLWKSSINS